MRTGCIVGTVMHVNVVPPAESPNLSYRLVNYAELGKSVFLSELSEKANREECLMECGYGNVEKSEGLSIIERIRIETSST